MLWTQGESNPHVFRHRILSPARLPISPQVLGTLFPTSMETGSCRSRHTARCFRSDVPSWSCSSYLSKACSRLQKRRASKPLRAWLTEVACARPFSHSLPALSSGGASSYTPSSPSTSHDIFGRSFLKSACALCRFPLCPGRESNSHECYPASPSSWCVYHSTTWAFT